MKKTCLLILPLLFILISCSNFSSKNSNNNSDSSVGSVQDKNVDNNFQITFNKISFINAERNTWYNIGGKDSFAIDSFNYYLETNFVVLNNTKTKILNLSMEGFVELQFQGEDLKFYPIDNKHDKSLYNPNPEPLTELNYGAGESMYKYVSNDVVNYEIVQKPWDPNTQLDLNCQVGEYGGYRFNYNDFKRTPIVAFFVVRYKASGIDGEYSNVIRFDILDKWKEKQTKLGFR